MLLLSPRSDPRETSKLSLVSFGELTLNGCEGGLFACELCVKVRDIGCGSLKGNVRSGYKTNNKLTIEGLKGGGMRL